MCLKVYVQSVAVKSNAFVSLFCVVVTDQKLSMPILKKKFSHFLNPKYTLNISGVCFSLVSFLRDFTLERERAAEHTKSSKRFFALRVYACNN